jgi:hypothetical protein
MSRRIHNPPRHYRRRRDRAGEHYHQSPDEWERDLLSRAYGMYLADKQHQEED